MKQPGQSLWLVAIYALLIAACSRAAAVHESSYRIATAAPEANLLSIFDGKADGQINSDGTACTWIVRGPTRTAIVWPPGYIARGGPLAVYDGKGRRMLVAGQNLTLGGGVVVSGGARRVAGCSGLSQSVAFVPESSPTIARPGSEQFSDIQVGKMQDIVSRFREVFGGLVGDPRSHIVTIYVAPTADPISVAKAKAALSLVGTVADPYLNYSPKPWRVGFLVAGPSLAALDAVLRRVEVAQPWRTDVGTKLVSWGIDPARHVVLIGVEEITPIISSDAWSAFGNKAVLETADHPVAA